MAGTKGEEEEKVEEEKVEDEKVEEEKVSVSPHARHARTAEIARRIAGIAAPPLAPTRDKPQSEAELEAIRRSIVRGLPYGGYAWREKSRANHSSIRSDRAAGRRRSNRSIARLDHPENDSRPFVLLLCFTLFTRDLGRRLIRRVSNRSRRLPTKWDATQSNSVWHLVSSGIDPLVH